jgi:phospholysine phosphohistidine inorganic pyrophosphate phosphatase
MKALLFDMDGVLYNSSVAIPGASEAMAWVRSQGIPHLFVTNTTSRARAVLVDKLKSFGILAREEDIFSPARATAAWLKTQDRGALALFIPQATHPEFEGLPILPDDAETGARFVIAGDLGEGWNFKTLNRAFRLLHSNPEAELIALGLTRFWQAEDGLRLDTAPFVAALENASRRKARVFGKPAAAFFEAAVAQLGVPASEVLMVGDDIEVDVRGAQSAGLKGALVKTGKFRPGDLEQGPDVVLDSIASLAEWWGGAKIRA